MKARRCQPADSKPAGIGAVSLSHELLGGLMNTEYGSVRPGTTFAELPDLAFAETREGAPSLSMIKLSPTARQVFVQLCLIAALISSGVETSSGSPRASIMVGGR
jgi:hypothetical protein